MKTAGVIAEYNPFHLGHHYHLQETRRLTGADYIVVVMSGNFTQRGHAAIMNKYSRASQALLNGADLVLELPVCFSASSAGLFAAGAVSLLDKLGVVDFLSFGSEEGDLARLQTLSSFLAIEPESYKHLFQAALKQGFSYPKARMMALEKSLPELSFDTLFLPNNILALEYCTALLGQKSPIKPVTVKRLYSDYHDEKLALQGFSSAASIRNFLLKGEFDTLEDHLPSSVFYHIQQEYGFSLPLEINDFSLLLHYRLLSQPKEELSIYADIHEDLADRIRKHQSAFIDYESFCDRLKTKELTHSRISRSLLHLLLDIRQKDIQQYKEEGFTQYARILGFRRQAAPLLHAIKANGSLPLISKLADFVKKVDPLSLSMLETDIRAAHIYESVLSRKFCRSFQDEYTRRFPIL